MSVEQRIAEWFAKRADLVKKKHQHIKVCGISGERSRVEFKVGDAGSCDTCSYEFVTISGSISCRCGRSVLDGELYEGQVPSLPEILRELEQGEQQ